MATSAYGLIDGDSYLCLIDVFHPLEMTTSAKLLINELCP